MKQDSMRTLTISLSPRQVGRLREAVESGDYASSSEVVRDALRLWERREESRRHELERLKNAYRAGKSSGEGERINPETFLADVNKGVRG